jgi:hypothetical protein
MEDKDQSEGLADDMDSGPFCKHWSDPSSCSMVCKCSHKCHKHAGTVCNETGCGCQEFEKT